MQTRRSLAALAAAAVTAVPLLASCGFSPNTNLQYTPGAGTDERSGPVDVLSAVIVSSAADEGTFVATLSNNDQSASATFDSVQGAEGNTVVPGDAEPLEIAPGGYANLADGGGVKLTGTFTAGDTIPLSVGFTDGTEVLITVPVVRACEEYAGLDPAASDSADPSADPSAEPSVEPTDAPETVEPTAPDAELSGSATAGEEESAESDPYACVATPEQE